MSQSNVDQEADVTPPQSDRTSGERHGRRVALITRRWKGEDEYTTELIMPGVRLRLISFLYP